MYIELVPDTLLSGFFFQMFFLDFPPPQPYKVHIVLIFYRFPYYLLHGYSKPFLSKGPGEGGRGKELWDAVLIIELATSL